MTGIYIHVPFCAKKCPYCDFFSGRYTLKQATAYKDAVVRNICTLPSEYADTVYFGGGTPSLLPSEYIYEILSNLRQRFFLESPEITIEANPRTVTEKKLVEYRQCGINRISIGVQSGNNDELQFLGRSHTYEDAESTVINAFSAGFRNISCDLMLGLKDQTKEKLEISIKKLTNLPISHISVYILKIEKNTLFGQSNAEKLLPDDDMIADLYIHAVRLLECAGFKQYEISNFAKDGFRSRHNLRYWRCEEYLGIGPSAHSYHGGKRYFAPYNLEDFCRRDIQACIYEQYPAGTDEEKIMLGLRLTDGICVEDFPNRKDEIIKKSEKYCQNGFAMLKNGKFRLTPKGFLVSNLIISDLI